MKRKQPWHKRLMALLLSLCMVCGILPLSIFTAGALEVDAGTGTKSNPIPIRTAEELADIAGMINSGSQYRVLDIPAGETVYYRLEADISLADYTGGSGWTPIGNETNPFSGHFDGNGHTISGMQIKYSQKKNYVGLFGIIDEQGSVSSLRIADSRIVDSRTDGSNGGVTAGLLAGKSAGKIENCEIGGTVKTAYAGGVVGEVEGGTLKNCLVTASVTGGTTGTSAAGGLYAKGTPGKLTACAVLSPTVSGKTAYALGPDAEKAVTETCIAWDTMSGMDGSTPDFTGAQTKSIADFENMKTWADVGNMAFLKYPWTYERELLPSLSGKAQPLPGYMVGGLSGAGTEWNPYTITNLDDLRTFAEMLKRDGAPGVHFKLTRDLDMTGYAYEDEEKGWKPLTPFRGIFDGGGYAIQNLYINRPDEDYIGFFSGIHGDSLDWGEDRNPTMGIVHDLGIADCDITGNANTGGLTGELYGAKIERCYSTGEVLGGRRFENPEEKDHDRDPMSQTGGLVGKGIHGIIRSCYSKANVRGVFAVGGIAGQFYGTMTDCYTTGDVTGDYGNGIGGILGMDHSDGTFFRRCYSMSKVTAGPLLFGPVFFGNAMGTGGIAGWAIGKSTDLVALNPSVSSKSHLTGYVNKCVGFETDYYNENERLSGWMGTVVNGKESGLASPYDSYAEAYLQPETWRNFTESGAWNAQSGKLPILNGVGGPQDGTPPPWFHDGYEKLYNDPPETNENGTIYYIKTAANLAWCSLNTDKLSNKILDIQADLDLSAYTMNGGWIPIGTRDSKIVGLKVLGNNHVITGLTIQNDITGIPYYGLFGILYNSSISDLHLRNVDINLRYSESSAGMLAGEMRDGVRLLNCSVQGRICALNTFVGGMVGSIGGDKAVDLRNLSASGRIEMTNSAGSNSPLAGGLFGNFDMSKMQSDVITLLDGAYTNVDIDITGNGRVGGIAGGVSTLHSNTTIKNCYSRGSINGGGDIGGIFGEMSIGLDGRGGQTISLSNCYAAGSLTGTRRIGGIVGCLNAMFGVLGDRPDKHVSLSVYNVAALAENVSGAEVGRIFGIITRYGASSDNPLDHLDINANLLFSWDGTAYKQNGYPTDPLWKGQEKAYDISSLTTEDVVGRWDGNISSGTARYFSNAFWKPEEGWTATPITDYIKNKAMGRLPTLTLGGNADKHIYQVGDVPLYISMKHPEYITEFNANSKYSSHVGVYSRTDLDYLRTFYEQHRASLNVHLTRDIQMVEGQDFVPIGHAGGNEFVGTFDGHGYVIRDLWVRSLTPNYPVGLIGRAYNVHIKNLGLVDPNISGTGYAGGLVGEITESGGAITNCFVSTSSLQAGNWGFGSIEGSLAAGGLVGKCNNTYVMTIKNCYTAINVQGRSAGGLVGIMSDSGNSPTNATQAEVNINNVFVAGQIFGFWEGAGGLIGSLTAGKVTMDGAVILSPSIESPNNPEKAWFLVGENVTSQPLLNRVHVLAQTRARGVAHADLTGDQIFQDYTGVTATLEQLHTPKNWEGFDRASGWTHEAGKSPVLKSFYTYRQGNYLAALPVSEDKLEPNAEGWYEIHNAQDWLTMCNMVNNLIVPYATGKYKLMADIDLGKDTPIFVQYQPVGQGSPFYGELDGNGKTVRFGQMFSGEGGLFGRLGSGGSIHDLTAEVAIQAGRANALGGVVAQAEAGSTLQNITVTGSVQASDIFHVGGVVGDSAGTVKNCVNTASIKLTRNGSDYLRAGGIVGRQRDGVIIDCRNEGRVDADRSNTAAGGIVGNATLPQTLDGPSLQNCLNTGVVSGQIAGGLIGEMTGGLVNSCASTGDIYGDFRSGGLVGRMFCPAGYTSGVTDCYATGAVTGDFAGGLFGILEANNATRPHQVARCYTTSRVTADRSYAGGGMAYIYVPKDKKNLVLSDLAALNPEVSVSDSGGMVGAFVGNQSGSFSVVNGYAFDEMVLTKEVAHTKTDGVDDCGKESFATIAANAAFWNDQMGFGGGDSLWNSSGGEGAEIKLPTLLHLNGTQSGELPYHLRTFARPQNTTLEVTADKTELLSPKGQDETVVFTAKITGTTETAVEWSCSDTTLTATGGADAQGNPICTLTIPQAYKEAYSGGEITVTATLKANNAITNSAAIAVKARTNAKAPEITVQPKDTPAVVGKPAKLSVTAQTQDGGTLSYQWYKTDLVDKDGKAIPHATGASYDAPAEQTGISYYYCVITNTIGDGEGVGLTTAEVKSATAQVAVTKDAQKALTIVGGNQVKTYGDSDFTLQTSGGSGTGTVLWKSSNQNVASVNEDTGKVTIHKAGEARITAEKAGDNQFDSSSAQITVTVNKAILTVTADDKTREYGQGNPSLTYKITGFVKGENASVLTKQPVAVCAAGTDAAVGTYPITVSGGEAENYKFIYTAGMLKVTKAGQGSLEILQGMQIDKTYGDTPFTLSVTGGSGNGKVAWASSDNTVASVDQAGKVTILKAGSATITATKAADGSYVQAQASTTVTVSKASLTVTAKDAEKHFGEKNPELSYDIFGFVNGENKDALGKQPTISVDTAFSETELPVGSYVIKVEGGKADNYDFIYSNGTLIVNKADQSTFQIEGGNPTKTYGDADFTLTTKYGAGGAITWHSGNETVAKVNKATGEITIVGAGRVLITAVSAETGNFAEALAAVTLTVEKAKLQINADPQTRSYGDENPTFTYTIKGFVNGDGKEDLHSLPILTADADKMTGVGSYAIRLAGGEDDNYEYVLNNAELTIAPRPITVQADDKEMTEGEEAPEFTWTVTQGNLLEGDTLQGSLKTDGTGVGTHPIMEDMPFGNPNYAVTFLPGTLTVAAKPVIPAPETPPTGDAFPVLAFWSALLALCGIGLFSRKSRKSKKVPTTTK